MSGSRQRQSEGDRPYPVARASRRTSGRAGTRHDRHMFQQTISRSRWGGKVQGLAGPPAAAAAARLPRRWRSCAACCGVVRNTPAWDGNCHIQSRWPLLRIWVSGSPVDSQTKRHWQERSTPFRIRRRRGATVAGARARHVHTKRRFNDHECSTRCIATATTIQHIDGKRCFLDAGRTGRDVRGNRDAAVLHSCSL
jgi:hypothetical protein